MAQLVQGCSNVHIYVRIYADRYPCPWPWQCGSGTLSVLSSSERPVSPTGPSLDIEVAHPGLLPVNQPGLATRWATQRVDGGSAGAVADWRWARFRAGTALWRCGAPVRSRVGLGRGMSSLRMLVR